MAHEGFKMAETAQDNMSGVIGGVVLASHNMQAIASEFAKMSLESIDNAANTVDRFSKATSWDQIVEIQNKYLKSSIDTVTTHSAKVAELIASWPTEMGKTYRQTSFRMAEAGSEAMKSAVERSSMAAEKMASAGEQASEAFRPHAS